MFKAVLFDFDGVVIDTEHKRFTDLRVVLKRYGLELEDSGFADLPGKKTAEFVREKFPTLEAGLPERIAEERRDLQHNELEGYKLIEGIKELLLSLKDKEYRLALVTGSQSFIVEELLDMNELSGYFEIMITGEDFKSSKPDPECYKLALGKLGLDKNEVVIIEDAPHGIEAGKKAGCKVFAVKSSFRGNELKKADKVFDTLSDIKAYFEKEK